MSVDSPPSVGLAIRTATDGTSRTRSPGRPEKGEEEIEVDHAEAGGRGTGNHGKAH